MTTEQQQLCSSAIKQIAEQALDLQTKINGQIEVKSIRLSLHTNRMTKARSVNSTATVSISLCGYAYGKEE